MSPTQIKKIRIQEYNLTLQNVLDYPAWEFALDEETIEGQDERTVRPYIVEPPLNLEEAYFIVRASFFLADGTQLKGLITPRSSSINHFIPNVFPYDLQPRIITENGKVEFCYGANDLDRDKLDNNYQKLGKLPSEVFPLRFSSDISVMDSITTGYLDGFMFFDKNIKNFYRLKSSDIIFAK